MKILVTGNTGYVGSKLVHHLRSSFPTATIIGFDNGYFAHCLTNASFLPERLLNEQYWGDIRDFPPDLLDGVDAVVHLAAISNDPIGNKFEAVTDEINDRASMRFASEAKRRGISSFVFASSCSIYGKAERGPRKETDDVNPLTAYARSKVAMERVLTELAGESFVATALRFATACGMSDRLRLDLVLNDFVACAVSTREITVLSDGTPLRPLIDVSDMARAIEWAITRKANQGGAFLAVNTGKTNHNVIDLANAVAEALPGTQVSVNRNAPSDGRSYQVDFSLFSKLAPLHQPRVSLEQSINELRAALSTMEFVDREFRNSTYMRLKVLEAHIAQRRLSDSLRWVTGHAAK